MDARKVCSLGALLFTFTFFSSQTHAGSRQITVENAITEKMTKYRHIFGRYKPSNFAISVNGKKIDLGKKKEIVISDNKMKVRYDYEFGTHKTGAKIVEFSVPDTIKVATITFNWKKKWRILIKGAKPLSVEEIKV